MVEMSPGSSPCSNFDDRRLGDGQVRDKPAFHVACSDPVTRYVQDVIHSPRDCYVAVGVLHRHIASSITPESRALMLMVVRAPVNHL